MEVEAAVRRELLNDPTVNGYVSGKVFRHTLWERIENVWTPQVPVGGRAVVVARQTGWAQRDRITTQEYPRVIIECWADADRDSDGETTADNAADNAYALYRSVDNALRAKAIQGASVWGAFGTSPGLEVIGCHALEEPTPFGPNNVPADVAQSMGDLRYVTAVYGLQVVHGDLTPPPNLLTGDSADFEGGTLGTWTGSGATFTLANTTEQAHSGSHSMKVTCVTSQSLGPYIAPPIPVVGGTFIDFTGWTFARDTARNVQMWADFYDANVNWINYGVWVPSGDMTAPNQVVGQWVPVGGRLWVPDTAKLADFFPFIGEYGPPPVPGEVHYFDDFNVSRLS